MYKRQPHSHPEPEPHLCRLRRRAGAHHALGTVPIFPDTDVVLSVSSYRLGGFHTQISVSYTHLDVDKRQTQYSSRYDRVRAGEPHINAFDPALCLSLIHI